MLKGLDKIALHNYCIQMLEDKIFSIKKEIANAKDSANADTKSSMGDKYETSRAMLQIEQQNLSKQLAETTQLLNQLQAIDTSTNYNTIVKGSLVYTDNLLFYMAAAIGKINVENTEVMVISPASPIGNKLLGAKKGDIIQFNNKQYTVKNIL
jgi:transcription elongation GreA/GreB family factor